MADYPAYTINGLTIAVDSSGDEIVFIEDDSITLSDYFKEHANISR